MLWLAIAAFLAAQQGPVIRVPVHLVSVPTLVFAGDGQCVAGLEASDFQVLDEGRPQHFTLDTDYLPPSVAVVVQVSTQVRHYLPFIAKVGGAVEDLLVGATGEAAVITYDDFVTVRKDFSPGGMRAAFRQIALGGGRARMIDAAMAGVDLLRHRPVTRSRILLLIGQPSDRGSQADLKALREEAERENVTIFALALPQFNKAFIEDTFSLQGPQFKEERGGYKAGCGPQQTGPHAGARIGERSGDRRFCRAYPRNRRHAAALPDAAGAGRRGGNRGDRIAQRVHPEFPAGRDAAGLS